MPHVDNAQTLPLLRDIVGKLQDELNGPADARDQHDLAVTHQLGACVDSLAALLSATSIVFSSAGNHAAFDAVDVKARTLSALAHQHIHAVPFYLVERRWLRLYTDAAICLCANRLLRLETAINVRAQQAGPGQKSRRAVARACVDALDRAIIVAGALGPTRMDWVQRLITACQAYLPCVRATTPPSPPIPEVEARPAKRARLARPEEELRYAPRPVPSTTAYPTLDAYLATCDRPLVLRRFLDAPDSPCPPWPALRRWMRAADLVARVGRGRLVPVEVGGAYTDRGWGQRIMSFEAFLESAGFGRVEDEDADEDESGDENADEAGVDKNAGAPKREDVDGRARRADCDTNADDGAGLDAVARPTTPVSAADDPPLYLAQHQLFSQFPQLTADFALPDYVWSSPLAPAACPAYVAPAEPLVNVWVGAGGGRIVSPAHTDPYYNCYAQVVGRKRVWLAPPHVAPYMYAYGSGGRDGDGGDDGAGEDGGGGGAGDESAERGDSVDSAVAAYDAMDRLPALHAGLDHHGHDGNGLDGDSLNGDDDDNDGHNDDDDRSDNESSLDEPDLAAEYMTNTSSVPIFSPSRARRRRFPLFDARARPASFEAVLGPGDVLLFPPGWWHAMRGEDDGPAWSLSMWF